VFIKDRWAYYALNVNSILVLNDLLECFTSYRCRDERHRRVNKGYASLRDVGLCPLINWWILTEEQRIEEANVLSVQ